LTDIQRDARFFYLQQNAFGGLVARQTFGTSTTATTPINLLRIEETLSSAHMRLSAATVENLPWKECFSRYDRAHTFFYADPPYWQTEGYGVPFGFEQYHALADSMRSCVGKVMVSINDHPDIRNCFSGFRLHETKLRYSNGRSDTAKSKERGELVITNWGGDETGGLFDGH
jgi:DNA adenine methylase